MQAAFIDEIFSSLQGEGPWVGERHVFVRFMGCDLRCRYCDTPEAALKPGDRTGGRPCRAQQDLRSFDAERIPNPLSARRLTDLCSRLTAPGPFRRTLSLTGGEPLAQYEFLSLWLPMVKPTHRIFLETRGIDYEALGEVKDSVDVVSMDFKLPSSTGLRPFWDEHRKFLAGAAGKDLAVKAVVTRDTVKGDIMTSAEILAEAGGAVPFILQPASGPLAPPLDTLLEFQAAALGVLAQVRIIPQAHTILKAP